MRRAIVVLGFAFGLAGACATSGGGGGAGTGGAAGTGTGGSGGAGGATGGASGSGGATGGVGGVVSDAAPDGMDASDANDASDAVTDGPSEAATSCIAELSAGYFVTCARKLDGTVWCWGINRYGTIGDGTTSGQTCGGYTCEPTPSQVIGLGSTTTQATLGGGGHACALKQDGTVWCWGRNESGALGDGTTGDPGCSGSTCKPTPVQVSALSTNAAEVVAGSGHTCARKKDSTVWCWGGNSGGELGDGSTVGKPTPAQVTSLGNAALELLEGAQDVTCARKQGGSVWCWGRNDFGQVGDGSVTPSKSTPVEITTLGTTAKQVDSGGYFTCAVKGDKTAWCWGLNDGGQLGDGTLDGQPSCAPTKCKPIAVQPLGLGNSVEQIAVGLWHACARKSDGTVWCWGQNSMGQLGDGTTSGQVCGSSICRPSPVQVTGLTSVVDIVAGAAHTCARRQDGTFWCWGMNESGQLGDGAPAGQQCSTTVCAPTPVKANMPCP